MHLAKQILQGQLAAGGATVKSLGVTYALLIAADSATKSIIWYEVHDAMKLYFNPNDQKSWIKKLDQIKKEGWRLHKAICASRGST